MPQTCDCMRALMKDWFEDEIDDSGPIAFLRARGYVHHDS